MRGKILLTGGAGYIGSHTAVELLAENFDVIILDNFYNSNPRVLEKIAKISGKKPKFYEGDIRDADFLRKVFSENKIDAVIHFAGLKAVGESVEKPLEYYDVNVSGSLNLYQIMREFNVKNLVFSSSATVYGDPASLPITEDFPTGGTTNPYGTAKLMNEQILTDIAKSDADWSILLLRYFNPIGAHESGEIGETPNGIPNNLLPYIAQVATGQREFLGIFGDDYDTVDGTGVRDYIHVVDLARGHIAALKFVLRNHGVDAINLGTGQGNSVLEMLRAFEKAAAKKLPYKILPRRPGDIAACYADTEKAAKILGWRAEFSIDDACRDTWNFQQKSARN